MSGFDNKKRFDETIIEIPNPFERGDIVKYKRIDGQEFSDLFISVVFLCEDGTFVFSDSIIPLDLERYEPKEVNWENGSGDTLLLCARNIYCTKGHLSTLFEVLAKYRRSNGK